MINYTHISRWIRADNYLGDDYSEYYVVASTHRDADELMTSNFYTIRKTLVDNHIRFLDNQFNHWGVGWIEQLMVHESNEKGLIIAEELNRSIEEYPVLDDDDYNSRRLEKVDGYYRDFKNSGHSALSYFGVNAVRGYMRNYDIKRVKDLKKRNILELIEGWWVD